MPDALTTYDQWIEDNSTIAALVKRQWLESVEGADAVIFPPTYPIEQDRAGYNIDRFGDGTNICQIDSVGSQANRMEPIFKKDKYKHLVPQVLIETAENELHILDAGHRAADAIVRFSTPLNSQLYHAFLALRETGDAETLARIAPTSIVFGAWDSRSTQTKLPRIVRSVIRAFNVKELRRSAQYSTVAGEILEGGDVETTGTGAKSELGFTHVPSVGTHGGIVPEGGIRQDAALNLVPLRALASVSGDEADNVTLRRYILGLCLVALTAPNDLFLREGCYLVQVQDCLAEWQIVQQDGIRKTLVLPHDEALSFANAAAKAFGVEQEPCLAQFDRGIARKFISQNQGKRKELLKKDPQTWSL